MNSEARRVLVVDDEKLIRWSVSERLTRGGYQVETAESGEQALEMVARNPPHLMLVDVRLPGMDGVTALRRAMALRPELVVILMSAHGTVDVAVDGMKHGAVDFLVKPFSLQALDEAVVRGLAAAATRSQIVEIPPGARAPLAAIIGDSGAMSDLRETVARLSNSNATTVLVQGESGAGKEVVARCIHFASGRAGKPFVQLNCAALPEQLLESELFGHERGAFTDAKNLKEGIFETAAGGTVMLDEIGDLPPAGQAKLLRLLENKTFRRVGGVSELHADVRVIAATNVDLESRVLEGGFRADLFYRLNVVRIQVPPMRERLEDIAPLAAYFIGRYNKEMDQHVRGVSPMAMDAMLAYGWPGNVRELRNVIERAFILHPNADEIRYEFLPPELRNVGARPAANSAPQPASEVMHLDRVERNLIAEALDKSHGNQSQAARMLGVSRDTLRYRLKKYGLA